MNIPKKYEDVVTSLFEARCELKRLETESVTALAREAALREEMATSSAAFKEELDGAKYTRRKFRQERDALQQRLTVAEQRVQRMVDCSKGQDSVATGYLSDILALLKPAAEECTSTLQHAGNLSSFAKEVIYGALEGGSFDGADIQDIAVNHGLLKIETRTEECGEVCACREYGFPSECYRKSDLLELKSAAEGEGS